MKWFICERPENVSAAGGDATSDSSDGEPRKASSRHWLLHWKLALDEGPSRDKTAPERKGESLGHRDQSCKNSITVSMSTWTGSSHMNDWMRLLSSWRCDWWWRVGAGSGSVGAGSSLDKWRIESVRGRAQWRWTQKVTKKAFIFLDYRTKREQRFTALLISTLSCCMEQRFSLQFQKPSAVCIRSSFLYSLWQKFEYNLNMSAQSGFKLLLVMSYYKKLTFHTWAADFAANVDVWSDSLQTVWWRREGGPTGALHPVVWLQWTGICFHSASLRALLYSAILCSLEIFFFPIRVVKRTPIAS